MGCRLRSYKEKKMKCSKCPQYSYPLRRCKLGKIKPPSIKGGVEAASFMGLDYICACDEENAKLKAKIRKKLMEKLEH